MLPLIINTAFKELKIRFQKSWEWRIGYTLVGGIVLARWLGLFSSVELITLDFFLRNRLPENEDERVVIVLIDEAFLQRSQDLPSSNHLEDLVTSILAVDPAVIGLNILGESPNESTRLADAAYLFEEHPNLIGAQKSFLPRRIPPPSSIPPEISEEQFGLTDIPIDRDRKIRRVFLGAYLPDITPTDADNPLVFSFAFKVAKTYLDAQGYELENFPNDPKTPSFRKRGTQRYTKIPRLKPNSGGYAWEKDIVDIQTVLKFRSGTKTFEMVDSQTVLADDFDLKQFEGKAIIIGDKDSFFENRLPVVATPNISNSDIQYSDTLSRFGILGVELEAHSTSQIINAVLDGRALVETIHPLFETVLVILAGFGGILISNAFHTKQATIHNASLLASITALHILANYVFLAMFGLWLPVFPTALALTITGIAYIAFYQSERLALADSQKLEEETKKLEEERRKTIDRIFNSIHAGPLQTLASLLRNVRDGRLEQDYLLTDLKALNQEIRGIGERLRQEAIEDVYFVDTRRDIKLDLTHPMHEVFYEVYSLCLQTDLPGFSEIKVRSVVFEPFNCDSMEVDTKQRLCWFLQESLENVGKHALGTTRLFVTGQKTPESYTLCIEDNGPGIVSSHIGEGTKLFYRIREKLQGEFWRESKPSGGAICKLTWPLKRQRKKLWRLPRRNSLSFYGNDTDQQRQPNFERPIHTLFYELCYFCLQKELPGFQYIETCSFTFEPCYAESLTLAIKEKLCDCLQESLKNVGKHACGTTRLIVVGVLKDGFYILSVEDNGPGIASSYQGKGTEMFYQLEEELGGKFSRTASPSGGTICKLIWPLQARQKVLS